MANEFPRFEEQMVLMAAEMPVLSAGLRERVLRAAVTVDRRRAHGRRALLVAGALVACLGLVAWQPPLSAVSHEWIGLGASQAVADESAYDESIPLLPVPGRYGRGELLISAGGDDWRLVEAEEESRQEGYRRLLTSF